MFPTSTKTCPRPQPQPACEAHHLPRTTGQQPTSKPSAKRTTLKTAKRNKPPPLPASVEVRGYEITIPNTKTCWRVNVVHSCGHPVWEVAETRYPGCDRPLVLEVNRHMRPCTDKCKMEGIAHMVDGLCGACWQSKHEQDEQASRLGNVDESEPGLLWDGLPCFE